MTVLCTLGLPYKIPGVVPAGQILSNSFSEFFSYSLAYFLNNNVIYPSIFINEKFFKYTTIQKERFYPF